MRRLVAVPLIVPLDRLYVNVSDDTLKIDQCHAYAGRVGRSLMSLWSSTHNRTRVMTTIQRLVQDTYRLVSRCAIRLDSPYVLKNIEYFSTESSQTRHDRNCLCVVQDAIPRLTTMLVSLQTTYEGDTTTESMLLESMATLQQIIRILEPVKHLLF